MARFLVHDGPRLVAQAGLEDRAIRLGESPVRIFGVVDLCVTAALRRQGIASQLLASVERLASQHGVDFLLLFADEHGFYRRRGFRTVANATRWLAIEDLRSEVILERTLENCFMVKQIGAQPWDDEVPVDLLGYLF